MNICNIVQMCMPYQKQNKTYVHHCFHSAKGQTAPTFKMMAMSISLSAHCIYHKQDNPEVEMSL